MSRRTYICTIILLLTMVGKVWAGSAQVKFQSVNRISDDGSGTFITAGNTGNEYALALADLTTLPSISEAQTVTIQFYSYIPSGSRWIIGLGDKAVRGTTANGSSGSSYNTDGLALRFGTKDGTYYRVNEGTNNSTAFDQWVLATITLDRQAKTYSYWLTQQDNTVLFSGTNIPITVDNITVIEAYSWANNTTIYLGDVTVSSDDLTGQFATANPVISQTSSYTQSVYYMDSPTYSIYKSAGALSSSVAINSTTGTLTGLTAGGAVWVTATDGVVTANYILTVAYRATAGVPIEWNFFEHPFTTSDGLKETPVPLNTTTGLLGETWRAEYKSTESQRAPEWYHQATVNGDNAFLVPETAGLIFHTAARNFYLRNDGEASFKHIGIRGQNGGASFTIPLLEAGDIVELNWKHDAENSGSNYMATNLKDLRGKLVDEQFEITRSTDAHRGLYSFEVVADGDVTFTLHDNGNTDLLKVRVYKGGYVSTMRNIRTEGGSSNAPNTLLVDGTEDGFVYERCNNLNSTSTGPGFYVLKGWREGDDDEACVTGSSASSTLQLYTDKDAYPVSDEEKARLYELRKNLKDFKMYNEQRLPSNTNYYNYGHISASGGWGKVTIRMNNYTNDMKYLIGYTPDFTLNIGSAPHQTYPYTWDFTSISTGKVADWEANVANAVSTDGINWANQGSGAFTLNVTNSSPTGSQYVPGAVPVTIGKALGKYGDGTNYSQQVYDELDGLGVDGQVTIHTSPVNGPMYCNEPVVLTLPDLPADGHQYWIYVSSSAEPTDITNAVLVNGSDANADVWKYRVTSAGAVNISFPTGCYIYKIGVTDMLKEIHHVGSVGWATESRNTAIDHELTGYFTQNDVNAHAVAYDSYDLNTATIALTLVMDDGYVPEGQGLVLKLDDTSHLALAEEGNKVPLFCPSYTRQQTTTPTAFGNQNLMYPNLAENRHYLEESGGYTKFILTNVHWTWTYDQQTQALSTDGPKLAEAAGFYRLHIYGDAEKDTMADNMAYLRVPSSELPVAVWNLPTASGAPIRNSLGIRTDVGDATDIDELAMPHGSQQGQTDSEVWHTLSGIQLQSRPIAPGLYILNGKKVVVARGNSF